jgi:competence protein ComEC
LVLIDGGASNSAVLSEIGKVIPFYRKHISIIISTHPDADHIGGLPKVIEKYNPSLFLESGVRSDTWIDKKLRNGIYQNNIDAIRARRGMKIHFEDTFLEILFPDRNVSEWAKKTNDASIVTRLEYKDTSFMFTGDSPISIENYLNTAGYLKQTDVLKVGHHGSKTSTMDAFVKKLSPKHAVISSGRKNKYGHPHNDVMNILKENEVTISSTAECGTIAFKSDGARVLPIDESCVVK